MTKVRWLNPTFVFGEYFEHRMRRGNVKDFKLGLHLATSKTFKGAIE